MNGRVSIFWDSNGEATRSSFFFFPDTWQTQRSWLKWQCVVERVTGQKHPQMLSTKRHWNFTWNKLTFFPRRKCWIVLFWRTLKVTCFVQGVSFRRVLTGYRTKYLTPFVTNKHKKSCFILCSVWLASLYQSGHKTFHASVATPNHACKSDAILVQFGRGDSSVISGYYRYLFSSFLSSVFKQKQFFSIHNVKDFTQPAVTALGSPDGEMKRSGHALIPFILSRFKASLAKNRGQFTLNTMQLVAARAWQIRNNKLQQKLACIKSHLS